MPSPPSVPAFTTVADLGSAGGAGIRLRDDIAAGRVAGPRIVAAGSWIGVKGGVCEFGGATVATPDEAGRRARADLDAGADLLKACITGWPAEAVAFPDSVQMSDALLAPVLTAASARKRPVYAHAIGQAGALLAAEAGVRALAHTPVVDSSGAARLRASGVRVISTLATLTSGDAGPDVLASFRRLRRAGVPIVLGTDAGVLPHGENAGELLALTQAGLTPLEALRAATVDAAALLELRDAGEIVTGARADLVIVEGDPLADVLVAGRPLMVIAAGRVVEERLDAYRLVELVSFICPIELVSAGPVCTPGLALSALSADALSTGWMGLWPRALSAALVAVQSMPPCFRHTCTGPG